MNVYIYSQNPKYLRYWTSCLTKYEVVKEKQLNTLEGILLIDYASYEENSYKNVKLVVLDTEPTFNKCMQLMQKGVKAYGNVYMHESHLLSAIESLQEGKVWMYPDFVIGLLNASEKSQENNIESKLAVLTSREAQIATLIYDGLTNKEIASKLDITTSTVKNHTKHIYEKLNVSDRLSLFAFLQQ